MKARQAVTRIWIKVTVSFIVAGISAPLPAADVHIFPGDSFENAVENLSPGDTLTVHEGTYTDTGRIAISVVGTAQQPVMIQGADGEQRPHITRANGSPLQNTINIEGAHYLTIKGLEISSNGVAGDGFNLNGNPSFITLEDLVIHDITVGVNFRSSMHHITVRKNHIYRTYDTGEGMYVGCNNATCAVTESLIEDNWIHDTTAASQGDGIEIKHGSHSNIIRNNVIHDTGWPCIIVYGTVGNPQNIIEGNVLWNCGASGIQAASDAVIRNNIILNSPGDGFNSQPHQGATPQNIEFVHNTVIGGNPCVRLHDWNNKTGLVFANNAMYCDAESFNVSGLSGVTISGNVFVPSMSAFPSSGYVVGRSSELDFIDVVNRQVYPTADSAVRGVADPAHTTAMDFNNTARVGNNDAGAYTWTMAGNPGWYVAPGFKNAAVAPALPTVMINADPGTVTAPNTTTLTWSSTNTDNCIASGDWSGTRETSGTEMTGSLTQDSTYNLSCTGPGGLAASSVSVIVQPQSGNDDPPVDPEPDPEPDPQPDPDPNPQPDSDDTTENAGLSADSTESSSSALDPLVLSLLLLAGPALRQNTRSRSSH